MRKISLILIGLLAISLISGCRGDMFYKEVKKLHPESDIEAVIGSENTFIVRDSVGNIYYVKWEGWLVDIDFPSINMLVLKAKK